MPAPACVLRIPPIFSLTSCKSEPSRVVSPKFTGRLSGRSPVRYGGTIPPRSMQRSSSGLKQFQIVTTRHSAPESVKLRISTFRKINSRFQKSSIHNHRTPWWKGTHLITEFSCRFYPLRHATRHNQKTLGSMASNINYYFLEMDILLFIITADERNYRIL